MKAKIQYGVEILDKIIGSVALPWMKMKKSDVHITFTKVFFESDHQLILHLTSKYKADNDFARFILNMDDNTEKQLFSHYSIPLAKDSYTDSTERYMAMIRDKKSRWDVHPFESEIVRQFYLMAYNNSLQLLQKITSGAYELTQKKKIDPFGCGKNWSKAWSILSDEHKTAIVEYLINNKF